MVGFFFFSCLSISMPLLSLQRNSDLVLCPTWSPVGISACSWKEVRWSQPKWSYWYKPYVVCMFCLKGFHVSTWKPCYAGVMPSATPKRTTNDCASSFLKWCKSTCPIRINKSLWSYQTKVSGSVQPWLQNSSLFTCSDSKQTWCGWLLGHMLVSRFQMLYFSKANTPSQLARVPYLSIWDSNKVPFLAYLQQER